jgi:hypothetical protein
MDSLLQGISNLQQERECNSSSTIYLSPGSSTSAEEA